MTKRQEQLYWYLRRKRGSGGRGGSGDSGPVSGSVIDTISYDYSWAGDGFGASQATALDGGVDLPILGGGAPDLDLGTTGLAEAAIGTARIGQAAEANGTGGYRPSTGTVDLGASGLTDVQFRFILWYPAVPSVSSITVAAFYIAGGQYMRVNYRSGGDGIVTYRAGGGPTVNVTVSSGSWNKAGWNLLDVGWDADIGSSQAELQVYCNGNDHTSTGLGQGATGFSLPGRPCILCGTTGAAMTDGDGRVLFYGVSAGAGVLFGSSDHATAVAALGV